MTSRSSRHTRIAAAGVPVHLGIHADSRAGREAQETPLGKTRLVLTKWAIPLGASVTHLPIGFAMIILGIILLLIGYFTSLSILYTIGGILVVVGVVLWILGAVGRPVGGRKVWF
nr:hypothetical protein Mflv_3866 [Mycolicibacterium gilvum PYR-GCK]